MRGKTVYEKNNIILLLLSVINWFPLVWYVSIYTLPPLSLLLLLLSFCSPFIAVIYIITAIFFMVFKKLSNIWWGIIIIVINILYLLWSRYYLDILIHMT